MAPVANAYASEACGTDPKAAATAAARGWVLAIPVSWHCHPAPLDEVTSSFTCAEHSQRFKRRARAAGAHFAENSRSAVDVTKAGTAVDIAANDVQQRHASCAAGARAAGPGEGRGATHAVISFEAPRFHTYTVYSPCSWRRLCGASSAVLHAITSLCKSSANQPT